MEQPREARNRPTDIKLGDFQEDTQVIQWRKDSFSINNASTTGHLQGKK